GGRIIVSPNTSPAVIRRTVELGLDPAPGFATPSEAFQALEAGTRHLKLFPAITYGERFVTQLRAVLPPEAVIWAVGGVGPASMESWWRAGVRAFGLGGELYKAGQSVEVTQEKAAAAVAAIKSLTD
ncbi:MAG TPA: 2-dehydro-3-deoxy-6-phosphogalactonate aldolase, partial [Caulobacter sp.]|nr:2-dehydro-3-deoxy-6-phosphogalactonate aldolase [Caulobacter sp.]